MPRVSEFLEEIAKVVERLPTTSRPDKTFARHTGHTVFRDSPASSADGFAVHLKSQATVQGFGVIGQKQIEALVLLELGHAPFARDDLRGQGMAEDLERIADVLESKRDWPQGAGGSVDLVTLDSGIETDRSNPLWWVTPLVFRCVLWGPIWLE